MRVESTQEFSLAERTTFGFWVYLMSDCLLFASLFAVYAVLHANTFGGPSLGSLFSLPTALRETLILLTSSFTAGLALLSANRGKVGHTIAWLSATALLGAAFLAIEWSDFASLARGGSGPSRSGALSSFFALVGTHGAHVTLGALWMLFLIVSIALRGLTPPTLRRLTCLVLFWHFLDLVWIFIFSIVYLMGAF
ncbi:MAG: cytochrome o ubiquinol oxidase subunit III [Patescibacteria group bacterium]|nr:cytochrome o ubiquinol oxidase subunit III [Patescibacteria group bacterium]